MVDLGIKNKEMYATSKPEKDYDNEVTYPEVSVSGKLAEKMGAPDLAEGDVVEVPVILRVTRHSKTTTNGKTDYSMTLCIVKMGDMTATDLEDADDDLNEPLPDKPAGALAALHYGEEQE